MTNQRVIKVMLNLNVVKDRNFDKHISIRKVLTKIQIPSIDQTVTNSFKIEDFVSIIDAEISPLIGS